MKEIEAVITLRVVCQIYDNEDPYDAAEWSVVNGDGILKNVTALEIVSNTNLGPDGMGMAKAEREES